MCIIITKERGAKPLPKEIFSRCWDGNPDGAGILWNDGHTTTLCKGIMKKDDFMRKIKEVNKKENCFVIHTRIKTHGSVKPGNTHPFVSKTLGFAHNGILNVEALPDTTDSETFFKWTIEDKTFEWCQENKFLLDMATNGSRCVIFDMLTGDMLHLCEDDWVKDEKYPGYMFSNRNYQPYTVTRYSGYSGYRNCCPYGRWDEDWLDDDYNYTEPYDFDEKATKEEPTKLEKEAFDKLATQIGLIGIKRRKDNLNIDAEVVEEYLKQNCEKNVSTEAYADMGRMMQQLKLYEKENLTDNGIASMSYIGARLLRQWFGRAKSLGYTNVSEVFNAYEHYIQDIESTLKESEQFFSQEEKRLLERMHSDLDVWSDIWLEDTLEYTEDGEKDVLPDKDSKSGIQKDKDSKK